MMHSTPIGAVAGESVEKKLAGWRVEFRLNDWQACE
jgi:hypothetical protein